jgi:hypothetical protein
VVFADERKKICPTQVCVRLAIDGGGEDVGSVSGWISVGSERGQRGESPFGTLLCGGACSKWIQAESVELHFRIFSERKCRDPVCM